MTFIINEINIQKLDRASKGFGAHACRTINFTSSRQLNVINLRLDREHHKVFRQAFFQKGLPPEAYRKLKLMTLGLGVMVTTLN